MTQVVWSRCPLTHPLKGVTYDRKIGGFTTCISVCFIYSIWSDGSWLLVFTISRLQYNVCSLDQAKNCAIWRHLRAEYTVQLTRAAEREREGERRQCLSLCACLCVQEQGKQMLLLMHLFALSLPPIKDYRHITAVSEGTHTRFQMPQSSNDEARHYHFTAHRVRPSSSTVPAHYHRFDCFSFHVCGANLRGNHWPFTHKLTHIISNTCTHTTCV